MTTQEAFGKRLRQLRREKSADEQRDVEQSEVAQAVGDSQPNVARWERGRIPKDESTVRRLAAYYRVSFVWLLHGEGAQRPAVQSNAEPAEPSASGPELYFGEPEGAISKQQAPVAKKVAGIKRRPSGKG